MGNRGKSRQIAGNRGVSPRIRGNRRVSQCRIKIPGSIPAHTGEPRRSCRRRASSGVYPRAYGGTCARWSRGCAWRGLSPRIRGNQMGEAHGREAGGSIPAHTGEPARGRPTDVLDRVYPRAYGGTQAPHSVWRPATGLSPRIRGNLDLDDLRRAHDRSIPAHTGEPENKRFTSNPAGVYPRAYGGTAALTADRADIQGLSPRIRGNLFGRNWHLRIAWSIPAHTGEPARKPRRASRCRVYPRAYGGTSSCPHRSACQSGLSPRIRGNRRDDMGHHRRPGSIPAHTGEPIPVVDFEGGSGVYPRAYGGTLKPYWPACCAWGLSPRIRGNRSAPSGHSIRPGSIPAHTGEPQTS